MGTGAVACATLNPYTLEEYATATIGRLPDMKSYVFEGSLSELPTPPDYDPSFVTNHCDQWEKWIQDNELFADRPALVVHAQTGPGETLAVTNVTVQVLSRTELATRTYIACGSGAGTLTPGSHIEVDTRIGAAQASQGSDSNLMTAPEPHPTPPAQINLTSSDGESVSVGITGEPGLAYSGIVTVHLMVNGEKRVATLGSKEAPYRWIAPTTEASSAPPWDWNPLTQEWTQDAFNELNPADGGPP